jgi:hypothetical protein
MNCGEISLRSPEELQLIGSEFVFVVGRERVEIHDAFFHASTCIVR